MAELPDDELLAYYSARLPVVGTNNRSDRMPNAGIPAHLSPLARVYVFFAQEEAGAAELMAIRMQERFRAAPHLARPTTEATPRWL